MFDGIDPSIAKLLEKFVEKPESLSHLLFIGPPGSGKTTTAHNLVKAFHRGKKNFIGKALFLNSSDERSLEAVRSKVYPFARSEIHSLFGHDFFQKKAPKVIIFDEAETLTEQAQSALRPLLDKPASELLIIFLCNSISKIHSSILHRFLRICFETPNTNMFRERFKPIFNITYPQIIDKKANEITNQISSSDIAFRRGDIRFFLLQYSKSRDCNNVGWSILHCLEQEVFSVIEKYSTTIYIGDLIHMVLFLFYNLDILDSKDIHDLFRFAEADVLRVRTLQETLKDFEGWIIKLKRKFETENS